MITGRSPGATVPESSRPAPPIEVRILSVSGVERWIFDTPREGNVATAPLSGRSMLAFRGSDRPRTQPHGPRP